MLDRTIGIRVLYKPIKNVYLRVSPDKTITLSVPKRTSEEKVEAFLKDKRGWLEKQLRKMDRREDPNEEFSLSDGEIVRFLGQKRVLRRLRASKNETLFFSDPFEIRLCLKDPTDDALAHRTYRKDGRLVLENMIVACVDKWMPVFEKRKVPRPEIRVRKMRSVWGTCAYKKGVITLSENLLRAAPASIEYVVLHELTHFLYHAHDKAFYSFLSLHMPDWKARKTKLTEKD